ncbi:MAG: LemA family protein [Clostridiales bacterium]|jgi:LemA protein|nr:LemA family protein [Clostridiales bacterium]
MKKAWIIILAIVLLLAVVLISQYNGLVSSSEAVSKETANLDSQYQRRMDLIPNLVTTVKEFMGHETEIIEQISSARAAMAGAGTLGEMSEADEQLTSALNALVVSVENYPDLKSNETFTNLMDELAGTENRITTARRDYNEVVNSYNLKIKRFPTNLLAGMFGFEQAEYFEAQQGAENSVEVDFG